MKIRILDNDERELAYAIRFEVFVGEQNVPPEIELDAEDEDAVHIISEEDGKALGCARVILENGDAHIGRLAVRREHRGRGIGADICRFIIKYANGIGYNRFWLHAQLHAKGFYERLGFKPVGEIFLEAGIDHIKMELN